MVALAAMPSWCLLAGEDPNPRRIALGGCQPALEGGAAALRENPALLGMAMRGGEAGAGYTRAFGMAELPLWSGWAGWTGERWGAGVWMRHSSAGEVYREDLIEAGGAWKIGDWAIGAAAEAVQVAFAQGLGSAWSQDLSLGVSGRPLPWLSLGASGRQLLGSEIGASGQGLPRDLLAGLGVGTPDGRFLTGISTRLTESGRPTWQVGQQARLAPWLSVSGAVRLDPLELAVGAGTRWNGMALEASLSGEGLLGWQDAVALSWEF